MQPQRRWSETAVRSASFGGRLGVVFLAYITGTILIARFHFHRGLRIKISGQRQNTLDTYATEVEKCQSVMYNQTANDRFPEHSACADLCREAKELAILRQQYTQEERSANPVSQYASELFDYLRGMPLESSVDDLLKIKTCKRIIERADVANQDVDAICTLILIISSTLMYCYVHTAFSILFQTLLAVWAIDQMPMSAAMGAVLAATFEETMGHFHTKVSELTDCLHANVRDHYKVCALVVGIVYLRWPIAGCGYAVDVAIACVEFGIWICLNVGAVTEAADSVLKAKKENRNAISADDAASEPDDGQEQTRDSSAQPPARPSQGTEEDTSRHVSAPLLSEPAPLSPSRRSSTPVSRHHAENQGSS